MRDEGKSTFREIFFEGLKKFVGEIIGGLLLAVFLYYFPGVRTLITDYVFPKNDETQTETQRELELHRREEERLKEELKHREEALREAEAKREEEARHRAEAQKQLEAQLRTQEQIKESFRENEAVHTFDGVGTLLDSLKVHHIEPENKRLREPTDARAQFELGKEYYDFKDDERAVYWYRKAAEQGHADAQFNLGLAYRSGKGVRQNYSEAVKWFRSAAIQGHADAQFNLGLAYRDGEGVRQNYSEAVKWFRNAAIQGCVDAQVALTWLGEKW